MGINDDLLRWRQERAQRVVAEAQEAIKERHQVAEVERNRALSIGDIETAEAWDDEVLQLNDEWQQVSPPPPPQAPQLSAETQKFVNKHQAFFRQPGSVAASKAAHELAVRAGLQFDSPDYFKFCSDALEMYGQSFNGTKFDPSEQIPHADEVVKFSGVTPELYNDRWRKMMAEGHDSGSQQRAQWSKKVG